MKKSKRSIVVLAVLTIIIISIIVVLIVYPQFLARDGELYTYVYEDGTVVEYYMDEDGHPYNYKDGKKTFISLPLEQFIIKDQDTVDKIKDEIESNQVVDLS